MGIVDNPMIKGLPRLARVSRAGRFRLKVRPKQSVNVQPILVSGSGEARACGKPLKIHVRAGVTFATSPRTLRNGQSIHMGGRVAGMQVPERARLSPSRRARKEHRVDDRHDPAQ